MSGIYERVTNPDNTSPETSKIAVHRFTASLREMARGNLTRANVISGFDLDAGATAELDAIIARHQSLPSADQRADFRMGIHDALLLAESGDYDKAKVRAVLGF